MGKHLHLSRFDHFSGKPTQVDDRSIIPGIGDYGKHVEPSGITLPAATVEKLLPSASLACTINDVNYVSNKNIDSLEAASRTNLRLDAGFFPGSGFQDPGDAESGTIRGRAEVGDREATLQFTARFENGSTELTKLKDQTEGTAVISLTYDPNNSLTLTYHRVRFSAVELSSFFGSRLRDKRKAGSRYLDPFP